MHRKKDPKKKQRAPRSLANRKKTGKFAGYSSTLADNYSKLDEAFVNVSNILHGLKKATDLAAKEKGAADLQLQLDVIFKALAEIDEYLRVQGEKMLITKKMMFLQEAREDLIRDLIMYKKIRNLLADICEMKNYVENEFFISIYNSFCAMQNILMDLNDRTCLKSSNPKDVSHSAQSLIMPHYLETLLYTLKLEQEYYQLLKAGKANKEEISHVVAQIKIRVGKINEEIEKLLEKDKREFCAYDLALKAEWELIGPNTNCGKAMEHYHNALIALSNVDSIRQRGLKIALFRFCKLLSISFPDDSLAHIQFIRHWTTEMSKWYDSSSTSIYSQNKVPLDQLDSKLVFYYYDSLSSLDDYSKCERYFEMKPTPTGIILKPRNDATENDFFLLMRELRDAHINFTEGNDQEIIFDVANHYVTPEKLLHVLTKVIDLAETSTKRLLDSHQTKAVFVPELHALYADESEDGEKEKEKEVDYSEKEQKWQNHLANEAKREELRKLKSKKQKLEIIESKEKEDENGEKEEEYVLKASLSGKRPACYHLSIDDELRKKLSQEQFDRADRIIRNRISSQIIFFKSEGKVMSKLKIPGENIRLFAQVEKMYKEGGVSCYSVNYYHPEPKHRNKN